MNAQRATWSVNELLDEILDDKTVARKRLRALQLVPAPLDHEAIEEAFEPEYILDTHGTIILFRNRNF